MNTLEFFISKEQNGLRQTTKKDLITIERAPNWQKNYYAKRVLPAVPSKKAKCYNCKFASTAFKIAGKTHHQCNHPKHEEGFNNGTLSPWDTLQEFYNTCDSHEFRQA